MLGPPFCWVNVESCTGIRGCMVEMSACVWVIGTDCSALGSEVVGGRKLEVRRG